MESKTKYIENEERRKYIIDNYKELIPDIEDYVLGRRNENKRHDYRYLYYDVKQNLFNQRYAVLASTLVDIRNNTDPVSPESNTIVKTDNKFSNETKKMVKMLLAKGWTVNEIIYEMEKVYGSGIVSWDNKLQRQKYDSLKLFISSMPIWILGIFMFKIWQKRNLVYKYKKFNIFSRIKKK
jgi:hypothetical protein